MFFSLYSLNHDLINEYIFSTIFVNINVYLVNFYVLFLILSISGLSNVIYLSSWNNLTVLSGLNNLLYITLLGLSSVPPTSGFFSKSFLLLMLLVKKHIVICIFLFVFNLFAMFFYLHNLRYLSGFKSIKTISYNGNFVYLDSTLNVNLCFFIKLSLLIIITFTDCLILSDYLFLNLSN